MLYLWFFAAGLIHIPVYSFPWSVWLLICATLASFVIARVWFSFAGYLACALLGMAIGSWNLQKICDAQLLPELDQSSQFLSFTIVSIPKHNPNSSVFLARIEDIHCAVEQCPELKGKIVRLSWYRPQGAEDGQELKAGQVWQATVKLRRPRGFVNPYGFDYHAWLLMQDVVATGSVSKNATLQGEKRVWAFYRERLVQSLLQTADTEYQRFWAALLIGEFSQVTQKDWQTLQATGTVHLMVISGLHISLAGGWFFLLGALFSRLIQLCHSGSNAIVMQFLPPVMACIGAGGYAALAGFSIPTIRASVACMALMSCRALGLNFSPFALLGMALVMVGLCEPLAWENAGFWLSFLAVALLFYCFAGRLTQKPVSAFFYTQPMMALGLTLPLLMLGLPTSLTGPVANLIAVPVVSFIVVPALIIAAVIHSLLPAFAGGILQVMDVIFSWLWQFLQWLEQWPAAVWWPAKPFSLLACILVAGGTLLMLAPAGLAIRWLGFLWLIAGLWIRPEQNYDLRVTVLDVGQGQAVVLQTPRETWLYDAGPAYSDQFDAGSRIVAPYLRRIGVRKLNLMVSHADLDHAGGIAGISEAFRLQRVFFGEPLDNLEGEFCQAGQEWHSGKVKFSILWPPAGKHDAGNQSSCVLLIEFPAAGKTVRLLLPGDIDRATERRLLGQLPQLDWLLAPHHGSRSSSSYHLLYRTQPRHVVFSAGYQNRYGHPHPSIEKRYKEIGSEMYNTAAEGALIFNWSERGLEIERARERWKKLWRRVP